jgi:hypothetical protein
MVNFDRTYFIFVYRSHVIAVIPVITVMLLLYVCRVGDSAACTVW